jgi:Rrf2 family protein
MAGNSRLAIAVHIAGMLSFGGCEPLTSEMIARSVGTNPVVVRRIIGLLTRAGIVSVRKGASGGASLAKPAEAISLGEIYRALGEKTVFDVPELGGGHQCPVGRIVRPILSHVFRSAEDAMAKRLGEVSLAELIGQVRTKMDASGVCAEFEQNERKGRQKEES